MGEGEDGGDGFIPFVLTVDRVLSTPVAPDFPCHEGGTRVETRVRPTMEVFFSP